MPIALSDAEFQQLVAKAQASAPGAALNAPFMYQARPDHGLYGMVAPAIGRAMGMQNPQMMPRAGGPGMVNPFDALYAQQNMQVIRDSMSAQNMNTVTQALGSSAGGMMTNLGIHRAMGMTPDQLQAATSRGMHTDAGQLILQQALGTQAMKGVVGGDVLAAQEMLVRSRHDIGLGGRTGQQRFAAMNPLNMDIQREVSNRTALYGSQLFSDTRMRDQYGGMMAISDPRQTSGFKYDQLTQIGTMMGQRNATVGVNADGAPVSFRNAGHVEQSKATLAQAKTLGAIGEAMGSNDVNELMNTLDQLTNRQWSSTPPDKDQILASVRNIKATADVLGVSSREMMNTVMDVQQSMSGLTTSQTGVSGSMQGGYSQFTNAAAMVQQATAVASETGQPVQEVLQRQQMLTAQGWGSVQGKDIMGIEWLRQEGRVSEEAYKAWEKSIQTGDKSQQKAMADRILEESFGDAATGRKMLADPGMLAAIMSDSDAATSGRAAQRLEQAQITEFEQRAQEAAIGRVKGGIRSIGRVTGRSTRLDRGTRASVRHGAISKYFDSAREGASPEEKAGLDSMQGEINDMYSMALEANGGDKVAAQAAVDKMIRTDPRFEMVRTGISNRQTGEEARAQAAQLGAGGKEDAGRMAAIKMLGARGGMLSDDQRTKLRALQAGIRTGKAGAGEDFDTFAKTLDPRMQGSIQSARERGQTRYQQLVDKTDADMASMDPRSKEGKEFRTKLARMENDAAAAKVYGGVDAGKAIREKKKGIELGGYLNTEAIKVAKEQGTYDTTHGYLKMSLEERMVMFAQGDLSLEGMLGMYDADPTEVGGTKAGRKAITEDVAAMRDMGILGSTAKVGGMDYSGISGKGIKGTTGGIKKQVRGHLSTIMGAQIKSEEDANQALTKLGSADEAMRVDIMRDPSKRKAYMQLAQIQQQQRQEQDKGEEGGGGGSGGGGGVGGPIRFQGIVTLRDKNGADRGTLDMGQVVGVPVGG